MSAAVGPLRSPGERSPSNPWHCLSTGDQCDSGQLDSCRCCVGMGDVVAKARLEGTPRVRVEVGDLRGDRAGDGLGASPPGIERRGTQWDVKGVDANLVESALSDEVGELFAVG